MIMDKNWLIRTKSNHILGPITKEKLIELFNNESLKPDDEICSGNGFWFFIREEEMVNRYLLGDEKQTFNPISEAKNVLTTDTVQVEQELSQDENTLVSNLNSMLNSTDEAPTAESKVESAPAKEADVLPLKKKTESKKIDNKITPQKALKKQNYLKYLGIIGFLILFALIYFRKTIIRSLFKGEMTSSLSLVSEVYAQTPVDVKKKSF